MKKFFYFLRTLTLVDLFRKIMYATKRTLSFGLYKKAKALYHFKNSRIKLGTRIRVNGMCFDISVGEQCYIYNNCSFEFSNESHFTVGSNVIISYSVVISCKHRITIGDDVQIGEFTSIRDSTHRHDNLQQPMKYAPDILGEVIIGNDVWVGRGCLIMPGSIIEDGVVVAANSVVKGKLERYGIYGGNPAKLIRFRNEKQVMQ